MGQTTPDRQSRWLPVLVLLLALSVYCLTLAPTVTLVDSGELIWAAYSLDIPHPPGFPLYVLVGWLFSHIPLGSVAQRLNFMSAFFAALSAAVLYLVVALVLKDIPRPSGPQDKAARRDRAPHGGRAQPTASRLALAQSPAWIAPLVAALSFAFSLTQWAWATVAEVYALNVFLLVAALGLLILWYKAVRRATDDDAATWSLASRNLYAAAFLFGLALGNHIVSAVILAPGAMVLLWSAKGRSHWLGRRTLVGGLALFAGLLVYLYLPLRAAQQPLLNWGNPVDRLRLFWHISGKQYQVNLFSSSTARIVEKLAQFSLMWPREFAWIGMPLILWGVRALWRHDRRLCAALVLTVTVNVLYAVNYDIAEDIDAYYLPTFLLSALFLGVGTQDVLQCMQRRTPAAPVPLGLLIPVLVLATHYARCDKHRYYIAHDYVVNTLASVGQDGLLLTRDWQFYSPAFCVQHVEGARTDVTIVDTELLRRTWYFDYLRRVDPALMQAAGEEVDLFLHQLRLFEYGRPYNAAEIQTRYVVMINALLGAAAEANRPLFVGLDMEPGIGSSYGLTPRGLVFRLSRDSLPQAPLVELNLRGLNDSSVCLDEVALRVRRTYAVMAMNGGAYLASQGGDDEALTA